MVRSHTTRLLVLVVFVGLAWLAFQPVGKPNMMGTTTKAHAFAVANDVGLAILAYASDHANRPPPAITWKDCVRPYLLRPRFLDEFRYALQSEGKRNLGKDGQTRLGYVATQQGVASVYDDMSVNWVEKP